MRYLIDGYNALFAWGLLRKKAQPHQLEQARLNFLQKLRQGGAGAGTTVVFDARHAPARGVTEEDYHGVRVCFADGAADDHIEELLRHDGQPVHLTVVSNDRRLRDAARRRGCRSLDCFDYLEELQRRPVAAPTVPAEAAKPEASSPEEQRRWLEAFGEADGDS